MSLNRDNFIEKINILFNTEFAKIASTKTYIYKNIECKDSFDNDIDILMNSLNDEDKNRIVYLNNKFKSLVYRKVYYAYNAEIIGYADLYTLINNDTTLFISFAINPKYRNNNYSYTIMNDIMNFYFDSYHYKEIIYSCYKDDKVSNKIVNKYKFKFNRMEKDNKIKRYSKNKKGKKKNESIFRRYM